MPYMTGQDDMRPTSASKLTCQEFLGFPGFEDDGLRHELIDGAHIVTPSPAERHQRMSVELTVALANHLKGSGAGRVYHAPLDVVLSDHDVFEPDLFVILNDQLGIVGPKNVRGAPAIVIEILSPGTRRQDEGVKLEVYARAGVREYWMVDPDRDAIIVCRQSPRGVLETTAELTRNASDILSSPLLPGFSLALSSLFARSAR
jgi:Uma2 family endonuclease